MPLAYSGAIASITDNIKFVNSFIGSNSGYKSKNPRLIEADSTK